MLTFIISNRRTRRAWKATAYETYFYFSNKFGNVRDAYIIANADTKKICYIEDVLREIDRNRVFVKKVGSIQPPAASKKEL